MFRIFKLTTSPNEFLSFFIYFFFNGNIRENEPEISSATFSAQKPSTSLLRIFSLL